MSSKETAEVILIVFKKIGKWILIFILFISLALSLFIAYDKLNQYFKNRPEIVSQLKEIKLGDKFSDLMFKNPGFVRVENDEIAKFNEEYYENKNTSLTVTIKDKLVSQVNYICKESSEYTSINGISCGSSGDLILEKYGNDVRVQCLKNKSDKFYASYRVYDVVRYGVRHHVVSNSIKGFMIVGANDLVGYTGINWTTCE